MPFGRSVSSKNSASRSAPIGVALAGFTTIGAPTASAGATLCATRFSGKLNGVIPSIGPIGNWRMIPIREPNAASVSRRISSSSPVAERLGRPAERRDRAGGLDASPT